MFRSIQDRSFGVRRQEAPASGALPATRQAATLQDNLPMRPAYALPFPLLPHFNRFELQCIVL